MCISMPSQTAPVKFTYRGLCRQEQSLLDFVMTMERGYCSSIMMMEPMDVVPLTIPEYRLPCTRKQEERHYMVCILPCM